MTNPSAQEQSEKERSIAVHTGSLDGEALRKTMYDAIERVDVIDGSQIEILWKFDDLLVSAQAPTEGQFPECLYNYSMGRQNRTPKRAARRVPCGRQIQNVPAELCAAAS